MKLMKLVLLAALFSMLGCSTMETVAPDTMAAVVDTLKAGDRISVRTAAGWHEDLSVVDVDDAYIRAVRGHEPVVLARADTLEIQVRQPAPGRTAALAAGIYLLSLYALCGNPFRETATC